MRLVHIVPCESVLEIRFSVRLAATWLLIAAGCGRPSSPPPAPVAVVHAPSEAPRPDARVAPPDVELQPPADSAPALPQKQLATVQALSNAPKSSSVPTPKPGAAAELPKGPIVRQAEPKPAPQSLPLPAVKDSQTTPSPAKKPVPETRQIATCALIDFSRTPTGALFEASVLGSRDLKWVERAQVDKVIAEQELQAMFSPEGGGNRSRLGKLLQADVLILVREAVSKPARVAKDPAKAGEKKKVLEIVICESQQGLRIAAETVPVAGQADAEAKALEGVFDGALARFTGRITDICAVPPFLNQDLDYKHDHLKSAFARALERHLLKHKGTLLVEFAEAQAIAREANLTGQGVARRLPLYFMGEFRHEAGPIRVQLHLKLQRGDTVVGVLQEKVAPPMALMTLIRMADQLGEKVLANAVPAALDAKVEVAQLVARAAAHERLGNWKESLELLETALLLDPSRTELHIKASHSANLLIRQKNAIVDTQPEEALNMLRLYRRSVEHMEIGLRPRGARVPPVEPNQGPYAEPTPSPEANFAYHRVVELRRQSFPPEIRTEFSKLLAEVVKEHRDVMGRLCRLRAKAGLGDEHRFLDEVLEYLAVARKYSVVQDLIQDLKDLPHARTRTFFFLRTLDENLDDKDTRLQPFLDELAKSDHAEVSAGALDFDRYRKAIVAKVKKRIEVENQAAFAKAAAAKAAQASSTGASFELLPLHYGTYKSTGLPADLPLRGCLPLGPNLDFVVSQPALFLMREKGVLKPVFKGTSTSYCFDGKFVWFAVTAFGKAPRLLVLNPHSTKGYEVNAAHGLPVTGPDSLPDQNTTQLLTVAPLGPGKVMLAGSFGKTWLAIATLDTQSGKRSVNVFHEARDAPLASAANQWSSTTVAFEPKCMFVLDGKQGTRRVFIGRGSSHDPQIERHPLLVDPDSLKVEVMSAAVSLEDAKRGQVHEGALHYTYGGNFYRLSHPFQEPTPIMMNTPGGRLLIQGDEIHIITGAGEIWHGSLARQRFRLVGKLPGDELRVLAPSSHYGVLATTWGQKNFYKNYQVRISGTSRDESAPFAIQAIATGAVLDGSGTPLGAQFEEQTLANGLLVWTERSEVRKLIARNDRTPLFNDDADSYRAGLARLLKVNVLVALRASAQDDKKLEVMVCEGQRGERLAAQTVSLTGNADTDLKELDVILRKALAGLGERIRDVCAVKRFVSHDTHDRSEYLTDAMTRALEMQLLQRHGTWLVAPSEIDALTRKARAERASRLPLLFHGDLRMPENRGTTTIDLELKMRQGDATEPVKMSAPLKESAASLRRMTDKLAGKILSPAPGSEADVDRIVEDCVKWATLFESREIEEESLALLETALVLAPGRASLHYLAHRAAARLAQRDYDSHGFHAGLEKHRRCLEHADLGLRPGDKGPGHSSAGLDPVFLRIVARLPELRLAMAPPTCEVMRTQLLAKQRQVIVELCRLRARAGMGDESLLLSAILDPLAPAARYDILRPLIQELKDLPGAQDRTIAFTARNRTHVGEPGYAEFLAELARDAHPDIRAAGLSLQKSHESHTATSKREAPAKREANTGGTAPAPTFASTPATSARDVRFQTVDLSHGVGENGRPLTLTVGDCIPMASGIDFLRAGAGIFVMKEKGILTEVWAPSSPNSQVRRICFDGRYLWFVVNRLGAATQLRIMDPNDFKTWELTPKDGLPGEDADTPIKFGAEPVLNMAPLAPGRICLAGTGDGTWIAIATFDPHGAKRVKVFHEAREAPRRWDEPQAARATIAFEPACMYTLTGKRGAKRVLIGRKGENNHVEQRPLMVDAETLTVEVTKEIMRLDPLTEGQVVGDAVYYRGFDPSTRTPALVRFDHAGVKEMLLAKLPDGSRFVISGDDVHVVGKGPDWLRGSLSKKELHPAAPKPPGQVRFLGVSNHYEVLVGMHETRSTKTYEVITVGKGTKK